MKQSDLAKLKGIAYEIECAILILLDVKKVVWPYRKDDYGIEVASNSLDNAEAKLKEALQLLDNGIHYLDNKEYFLKDPKIEVE